MTLRIAINGYGRIGRCVLRALQERQKELQLREEPSADLWKDPSAGLQIVAINELADCKTIAHLTKYDSTHGRFPGQVELQPDRLLIDKQPVELLP